MSSVSCHQLEQKFSAFGRKFISSIALADSTSNFSDQHPIQFLNARTNPRNIIHSKPEIAHAHLIKTQNLESNVYAANSLLDAYCKLRLDNVAKLLDEMPNPNTFSWNLMISNSNKALLYEDAWRLFCRMHMLGFEMNMFTYGSVLSACGALTSTLWGEQVYGLVMKNGFFSDGYVRCGMIELFSKSCRFRDALRVFYDCLCDNVVCWNAIIAGAIKNREYWVGLDIYKRLWGGLLKPNEFTIPSVLNACVALLELRFGKTVHGAVIKCGLEKDVFVGTAIVDFYAKCGVMEEAFKEFMQMPVSNVVSWTAMLNGFVQNGDPLSAVGIFAEMRNKEVEINSYTVTSVLTACANPAMAKEAIQIHSWIYKTGLYQDPVVQNSLINMYSKIGEVSLSEAVFAEAENLQHLGLWSNMISVLAQNSDSDKVIHLFQRIFQEDLKPDKFCCSSVLGVVDCLDLGRQIHSYTLKSGLISNVNVSSSLFTMYSKCGSIGESYIIFELIEDKDNVSWASMIAGLVEHGFSDRAVELFREMSVEDVTPDEMTLTAILNACSSLQTVKTGKEIHGFIFRHGVGELGIANGAIVNMYTKCSDLVSARRFFDMLPLKDKFSCTSMVTGYAQRGYVEDALQLFKQMLMADLDICSFTISSILGVLALSNRSGIGIQVHAYCIKMGSQSEASTGGSLVMMYSKGGSVDDCCKAFEEILAPDLVSWTAMIVSYAQNGKGDDALHVYELMRNSGIKPDSVTFVGVLSACSHAGLVEEGYFFLTSMMKDYGIEPGYRHYACMVDLLGRSGRLTEAERFISEMPMKPDALVWGTLLAACKVHGDVELGKLAANKIIELEPSEVGAYISLSNIWASVGQWEEVLKIRGSMQGTGIAKEPGWSSL
ncbi:pentatricopeptide repeat-containing protein At1g74600, chloroplastic [Nicotiana sylvestris]|uniref:Pentatricopeptide repeat-containing protein At1g74600, chloroplastic n=1 Tax=Nicotiana sylvestris TaxID=4096 RepID=A0A1U7Y428_NICSY|nr:PREDICTED: pentatricopeptide repeat-containing protein At1g74600, chloroplastic [Nicotiana sylvestris]XP_009798882.1 PREDICTED: pentatricopeptide repeat-containing protein At1g74600, chloroplastic [Nicotiana sylvestris]XP_009798883.1 PREDICTED: pentatricopeptide repeat-containing protein At1g74600, chloroplastic [Nicotiana sylvestris]XP_009798884.1 PREDICTED: pentatricopeptide repeat-containing protein At1g74600, chloroplastic [Nicotiana sylvestris]XP_009798886.1 PREDICTED: pentatricopeptide